MENVRMPNPMDVKLSIEDPKPTSPQLLLMMKQLQERNANNWLVNKEKILSGKTNNSSPSIFTPQNIVIGCVVLAVAYGVARHYEWV